MTIERDLPPLLTDWMQEDAILPDDLDEVLDQLPQTPQRQHRWSFTFPEFKWRDDTMFSAMRVAAGVAVLALASSLALVAGPLAPAADPAGPISSASVVEDEMTAPTSFRATFIWGQDGDNDGEEVGAYLRGKIGLFWAIDDPEPRVDGTARFVHDSRDDGGLGPQWGTFRLETEDGAWEGTMSGFWDRHETRTSGWLQGEDAYKGQAMYLETVIDHRGYPAQMTGIIIPGDPPTDPPTFD